MASFKILGTDGKQYGPISADVLRQWIAQGRISGGSSVQVEGGSQWKPLSSVPEFADALAPGSPAVPTPPPSAPVKTSKLAIASLVCGILGFLCLPGVAGLILGIQALDRIKRSGGQLRGRGLAIAAICVAGLMLLTAFPAGVLLPAMAKANAKAVRIACVSNLKQVCIAALMYLEDHDKVFPPDVLTMSNELSSPYILICPADTEHSRASSWAAFDPRQNLSYDYLKPGIAHSNAVNAVIFWCPIHDNVGLGDGSVQQRFRKSATVPGRKPR